MATATFIYIYTHKDRQAGRQQAGMQAGRRTDRQAGRREGTGRQCLSSYMRTPRKAKASIASKVWGSRRLL